MPGLDGDSVSQGAGCIPLGDPPGSPLPATHIHHCPVPVLLVDVQLFLRGVGGECLRIMEELGPLARSSGAGIYMASLAPVPLDMWAAGEPFCVTAVCSKDSPCVGQPAWVPSSLLGD